KSKADTSRNANIYLRITVKGQRAELSIRRKVPIEHWNVETCQVRGNSAVSHEVNRLMTNIRSKIYSIEQDYIITGKNITAIALRDSFLGKNEITRMVLEIFQEHNDRVERLIGKDFAPGTAERYRTAKKHVEDYIQSNYHVKDLNVKDINHKFISGFEYYLKTTRKCSHNTAIKYITNFKKIIRIAYA